MKKNLTFLVLLLGIILFAQEQEKNLNSLKNEVKLGVVSALVGPALSLEYERVLGKYSSFGGNLFIGGGDLEFQYSLAISPYYRIYFTNTQEYGTKGFFAQGFLTYFSGKDNYYDYNSITDEYMDYDKSFSDLAIGFALGKKWVNKAGFVFQANVGVARSLMLSDHSDVAILLGDLSVGYRF